MRVEHRFTIAQSLVVDAIGICYAQQPITPQNYVSRVLSPIYQVLGVDTFDQGIGKKKAIAGQRLDIADDEPA